jgi:hypothetical protein
MKLARKRIRLYAADFMRGRPKTFIRRELHPKTREAADPE